MKKTELFLRSATSAQQVRRLGYVLKEDALVFARGLRSEVADLVFLDPPFNLSKDYGRRSKIEEGSAEEYELYMLELFRELVRVMKPGSSLFLYHLPYWASRLSRDLQELLEFRHWIAIAMRNGFARGRRLYPAHYALLYYSKGPPTLFNRPRVPPAACRRCGSYLRDYGGYKPIIERNGGVNLSDFWEDLSPVRHHSRKHRSSNQLPEALTDRVMHIAGLREGLLVDPFVGSGTTAVSAVRHGMLFAVNDLAARNLAITKTRVLDEIDAQRNGRGLHPAMHGS